MHETFSAVIFDMDGVIVDSEPLHHAVETELLGELDVPVTREEHANFLGMSSRDMWTVIRRNYDLPYRVDELVQRERARFAEHVGREGIPLVPGILELVAELVRRDIPVAVASSSSRDQIDHVLSVAGIAQHFTVRVSGDDVAQSKPDPAIFLHAADMLGVAPAGCIVIEDSPHGVTAARGAGMRVIGFANHNSGSPDLGAAHAVCETMNEILYALCGVYACEC